MRKILFVLIFSILALPLFYNLQKYSALAQENANQEVIQQAIDNYLSEYNKYNQAHQEYLTAKNAYIKFATVASQREAVEKAKKASILRAEALGTYLQLLKTILNNQKNLDITLKSTQIQKIEETQNLINIHKQNMAKAGTIAEVNTESINFVDEINKITNLAYEALSIILIGEMQEMESRTKQILTHFEKEFGGIGDEKLNQGINDVNEKLATYREYIENAHQHVLLYREPSLKKPRKATDTYKRVKTETTKSLEILDEITVLFKEFEVRIKQWPI